MLSSGIPEWLPPQDCPGLRWITLDYFGFRGLPRITSLDHQVVQRITKVICSSALPWITRITLIYLGLLGITRVTPNYQFGSPRCPADYQSCFSIGITRDYDGILGLPRITSLDHQVFQRITKVFFSLRLPKITRITSIYSG